MGSHSLLKKKPKNSIAIINDDDDDDNNNNNNSHNNNDSITFPSGDLHANDNPGCITIQALQGFAFRKVPDSPA